MIAHLDSEGGMNVFYSEQIFLLDPLPYCESSCEEEPLQGNVRPNALYKSLPINITATKR